MTKISIIIPTLNESEKLPVLISDLAEIEKDAEIIIVDANSEDMTKEISIISGAKYFSVKKGNRGLQLNYGAREAKGKWLLFLHADSRFDKNWSKEIKSVIKRNIDFIYFFKFKIKNKKFIYRFLEFFVNLRSSFLKIPYGDQGLLINKKNFLKQNGFNEIPIMEDIDFISRVKKKENLIPLKTSIFTSHRKWDKKSVIKQSIRNWQYRKRWLKGESLKDIYAEYYKH